MFNSLTHQKLSTRMDDSKLSCRRNGERSTTHQGRGRRTGGKMEPSGLLASKHNPKYFCYVHRLPVWPLEAQGELFLPSAKDMLILAKHF